MIDFHTHILPSIDDGSRSVEMTLQMIEESKKQGVDLIVATPHFYPNVEDIESFIKKRDEAYKSVEDKLDIKVLKGAEVQYFIGISRNDDVLKLRIENTNTILVEMPFNLRFDRSMVNEIIDLSKKCTVVIAHFERYLENNSIELFKDLCNYNIYLQVNAASFSNYFMRRKLIKMVKDGYISVIASDMHNLTSRPQNIRFAYEIIEKRCGKEMVYELLESTSKLLKLEVL